MKNKIPLLILCGLSGIYGYDTQAKKRQLLSTCSTYTQFCEDLVSQIYNIQANLTICCDDIQNNFNTELTLLEDLETTLFNCCIQLEEAIEHVSLVASLDFSPIFTALVELSACNPTPITESTFISLPGSYCLESDIIGSVTINTNNVILDLNGHTISEGLVGITIQNGNQQVIIKNGFIKNTIQQGIHAKPGCSEISLENLHVVNAGGSYGIQFNSCTNCSLSRCNVSQGINGIALSSTTNAILQQCQVFNCSGVRGVTSYRGSYNKAFNCRVADFNSTGALIGFNLSSTAQLVNCVAQNLSSSVSAEGFIVASNSNLQNCIAQLIKSSGSSDDARGFEIAGNGGSNLENCVAEQIVASTGNALGYYLNSTFNILNNCQAINVKTSSGVHSYGFDIAKNDNALQGCVAINAHGSATSNVGFTDDGSGSGNAVDNCVAINCADYGFVLDEGTRGNIATNNIAYSSSGTNYSGIPAGNIAVPGTTAAAGINIDA